MGAYAALSALAVLIISPLLALAYFATSDGAYERGSSTVTMWATPTAKLAGGLLTFSSAEHVYSTYLQAFALIFPSILLCAWVARSRRPDARSRPERWSWRAAMAGYAVMSAGLIVAFCLEAATWVIGTDPHNGPLNVVFLALLVPGILLSTLGSSVLGLSLVRSQYAPRATGMAARHQLSRMDRRKFRLGAQQPRADPAVPLLGRDRAQAVEPLAHHPSLRRRCRPRIDPHHLAAVWSRHRSGTLFSAADTRGL